MLQLSPDAIENQLASGEPLEWVDPRTNKLLSIVLHSPVQRRLFRFLVESPVRDAKHLEDGFVTALKECFVKGGDRDSVRQGPVASDARRKWLLKKIETYGFGGLNTSSKHRFEYELNAQSACIEGPNGSGKSSLIGALTWALDGYRAHEHLGRDSIIPQPVLNNQDRPIATWPPLASYPSELGEFSKGAKVGVKLTFYDLHTGEEACVLRRLNADGKVVIDTDPRISMTTGFRSLVNSGVLLPCRLTQLRLNDRKGSLSEAVQSLTGLDKLAKLSDFVGDLCNGNLEFRRYARRLNQTLYEQNFLEALRRAEQRLPQESTVIRALMGVRVQGLPEGLSALQTTLDARASSAVATLAGEFAPNAVSDTNKARTLLAAVQVAIEELPTALDNADTVGLLDRLVRWIAEANLDGMTAALSNVKSDHAAALARLTEQQADTRLRLKIVAARWHVEHFPQATSIEECPLCQQDLGVSEIGRQLLALRSQHELAEQSYEQGCATLCTTLRGAVPIGVRADIDRFGELAPIALIRLDLSSKLLSLDRYKFHLPGAAARLERRIGDLGGRLTPEPGRTILENLGGPREELESLVAALERMLALRVWWVEVRPQLAEEWAHFLEPKTDPDSGTLRTLERSLTALSNAQPLREAADEIRNALRHVTQWAQIEKEQKLRDQITGSLDPLKGLRGFVEAQATSAIQSLSAKIGTTLEQIYLLDSLKYESTALDRQAVAVRGAFTKDYRLDATFVANTSWLRAFLWAFVFAYRSQMIAGLPENPLPLLLLDDPQATFDPQHRRKWAELIVGLQRLDPKEKEHAQVIVTTHDPSFVEVLKIEGFQGRMAAIHPAVQSGGAVVLDGTRLETLWKNLQVDKSPGSSQQYLSELRIEIESQLRLMLRGEGGAVGTAIWSDLRDKLDSLHAKAIPPFNRPAFSKLLGLISPSLKEVKFINWSHHFKPNDVGFAQAEEVERHWKKLRPVLQESFSIRRDHLLHHGDRPLTRFPVESAQLPDGTSAVVRTLSFVLHGRAAAMTDGRVADGVLNVEEFGGPELQSIGLKSHSLFRLTANTLEPVASAGDLLIVRNDPKVNNRNLVVTSVGPRLYARRFEIDEVNSELAILSAQAVNPYDLRAPIVVGKSTIQPHKVVGVFFDRGKFFGALGGDDEFSAVENESVVRNLGKEVAGLYHVEGRSAEPYALNHQYLMVGQSLGTSTHLAMLDGQMVLAVDEDGRHYFKRLRLPNAEIILLESLDISGREPSLVLHADPSRGGPTLARVSPVVGVLFEAAAD